MIAGVIMSAFGFHGKARNAFRARQRMKKDGTKIYEIWGPLFFGSITAFNSKFDVHNDPDLIEIDFIESRVSDHSAIEAVFQLSQQIRRRRKKG